MFKSIMCIILMGGTIHAMENNNSKALVKKEDSPPLPTKKPSGSLKDNVKNFFSTSNNNNNNSTPLRISDEELPEKRLMLPQTLVNHIEEILVLLKKPLPPMPNLTAEFESFKLNLLTEVQSLHNQRKQFEALAMRKIDGIALVCAGALLLNLFVIIYLMNHYK